MISDIWWPKIHREIILIAATCEQCQLAGKSVKTLLSQNQFGKIPTPENVNDEIALDFAGPYKIARSSKKYILVSIDQKSGWPEAMFLKVLPPTKSLNFWPIILHFLEFQDVYEQIQAQFSLVENFNSFVRNTSFNISLAR